jgi:microcystin-dependent protein
MRAHLATATAVGAWLLATAAAAQVTGVTGSGAPINNYQPSLVLTQSIQIQGVFPTRESPGDPAASTLAMIHNFAGNFGPFGQPLANGQLQSISQNTALFSILGTTYGGNGQSTFALPNLAGNAAMGAGQGPGLTDRFLGEQVGAAQNFMTLSQLPSHDHGLPGGGVTGFTGSGSPAPLGNMQPTLALTYEIAVSGIFPSQGSGGANDPFIGQVSAFAGNFATNGYLQASGQLLSISEFSTLFEIIGTTYGGDGQSTFALPNLNGRVIVGTGNGVTLGETFGGENTVLTDANLPSHDHTLPGGGVTDFNGGGQAFGNEQPSLGLNYLIALQGVFPINGGGGGQLDQTATLGEIVAFAGDFAPQGYAFAHGQLLAINLNQALFSILGTTYGGDGRTTFALPNLQGRTIVGAGGNFTIGELLGEQNTTLTVNQLAPHDHSLPQSGVPEPATWAMMIGGFGLAGAALRRRRRAVVAA